MKKLKGNGIYVHLYLNRKWKKRLFKLFKLQGVQWSTSWSSCFIISGKSKLSGFWSVTLKVWVEFEYKPNFSVWVWSLPLKISTSKLALPHSIITCIFKVIITLRVCDRYNYIILKFVWNVLNCFILFELLAFFWYYL